MLRMVSSLMQQIFPKQFKYVNIDNRVIRIDMSDYNVFVDITTMTEIR